MADVLCGGGTTSIAVEDPGSIGLRDQLTASGLTCVPVPVDGEGIRSTPSPPRECTPWWSRRRTSSRPVRSPRPPAAALLEWARSCGGLVLEDDYDAEFRYDRTPIGALQGLGPDVVLYGGSVSKTLAPGVRLGWLVVPEHLVAAYRDAKYTADLARGVLDQATFAELLASGEMDRHIRRMAVEYRHRRDHLVAAVASSLPDWDVTGTAAGLHLVLHAPGETTRRWPGRPKRAGSTPGRSAATRSSRHAGPVWSSATATRRRPGSRPPSRASPGRSAGSAESAAPPGSRDCSVGGCHERGQAVDCLGDVVAAGAEADAEVAAHAEAVARCQQRAAGRRLFAEGPARLARAQPRPRRQPATGRDPPIRSACSAKNGSMARRLALATRCARSTIRSRLCTPITPSASPRGDELDTVR